MSVMTPGVEYTPDMYKADVVAMLGDPDRILPRGHGMLSRVWCCAICRKLYTFAKPVRPPAPCECGGIAFEATYFGR